MHAHASLCSASTADLADLGAISPSAESAAADAAADAVDKFSDTMRPFVAEATAALDQARGALAAMRARGASCASYFCEEGDDAASASALLGRIHEWAAAFAAAATKAQTEAAAAAATERRTRAGSARADTKRTASAAALGAAGAQAALSAPRRFTHH